MLNSGQKHSQKLSLYSLDLFSYFTISYLPFLKFINYIVLDYMNIIKSSTRYRLCFPKFYIYRINNELLCYWEGKVKREKKWKGRRVFFASWHEYVTCTPRHWLALGSPSLIFPLSRQWISCTWLQLALEKSYT